MATLASERPFDPPRSLVTVVNIVYALHAISLGVGAFTAASVVGAFLFGWPSLLGVILNYIFRGDARGTWLESHFRWQIRTFWFAFLWSAFVAVISFVLAIVLVGFATWIVGLFALGVWAMYRIARGWLRVRDQRAI